MVARIRAVDTALYSSVSKTEGLGAEQRDLVTIPASDEKDGDSALDDPDPILEVGKRE